MRIKKLFFVLVALVLTVACVTPFATAFAGSSSTEIGSLVGQWDYSGNGISNDDWVVSEDGTMVSFDNSSTDTATAVSQFSLPSAPANGVTKYSTITSKMTIKDIADGSYFAIALGMTKKTSKIGEKNTLEIYFTDGSTGKINVSVRYIDGNGAPQAALATMLDAAELNQEFTIVIDIALDKAVTVNVDWSKKVDGNTVNDSNTPITVPGSQITAFPKGKVAFGQKGGKNSVVITNFSIINYEYMRPRNIEYLETFEPEDHKDGAVGYNANAWYTEAASGAIAPSYLEVKEDESGNSYLRYNNTAFAYMISQYTYSNWEMAFDYFDVSNKRHYDSNGALVSTPLPQFMVCFGINRSSLTSIRDHNTGSQGSIYVGWKANGASDDWETETQRYIMVLAGNGHQFRNGSNPWLGTNGSQGSSAVSNMPTNPFKYEGDMKFRVAMVDGTVRLWITKTSEYETYINGTEAEFIQMGTAAIAENSAFANPTTSGKAHDFDINRNGVVDATDYASRDLDGNGTVDKNDYYYVDLANIDDLTKHGAEPAISNNVGRTPTGNVMFATFGSSTAGDEKKFMTGSFSVDNLYINNLDISPDTFSTVADGYSKLGYEVNGWPQREETEYDFYAFYSDEDLLANKLQKGGKGLSVTELIIVLVCVGVIAAVAVTAVIIILKNKKSGKAEEISEEAVTANEAEAVEEVKTTESETSEQE